MENSLREILTKREGWRQFVSPLGPKLFSVIVPAIVLGYFFFKVATTFIRNGYMGTIESKVFIGAVVLLYCWFLFQMFIISCWVYTLLFSYQKGENIVDASLFLNVKKKYLSINRENRTLKKKKEELETKNKEMSDTLDEYYSMKFPFKTDKKKKP